MTVDGGRWTVNDHWRRSIFHQRIVVWGSRGVEIGMNEAFKALSDPTRREILKLLRGGDMNAGDIAGHFEISKPSISHHLNLLKTANLVQVERNGQELIYSINTTVMQDFLADILALLGGQENEV